MFREDFYRWLRDDFIVNRAALNAGGSFLAQYFKKHSYMVPKYNELNSLFEEFRAGNISKLDLFYMAYSIFKKGKLQIFESVKGDTAKGAYNAVKSIDPFKACDEATLTDDLLVALVEKVLAAMLDEKVKAYLYDVGFPVPRLVDETKKIKDTNDTNIKEITNSRKKEAILDLIDEFFVYNNISFKLNDVGEMVSSKVEKDQAKLQLDSPEFINEAKRVYNIILESGREDMVLPLYQGKMCGIYILGREVINSKELIRKVAGRYKGHIQEKISENMKQRIYPQILEEKLKEALEEYYNRTAYFCYVCGVRFWDKGMLNDKSDKDDTGPDNNLLAELEIQVCYSIENAIWFYNNNLGGTDYIYEECNGEFIPELGEKYRKFFEQE